MERIAVAGWSLHDTDLGGLERVARPGPEGEEAFLLELADELAASEAVLLSTCNRLEIAFAREEGHLPCAGDLEAVRKLLGVEAGSELAGRLKLRSGVEAVRYLFRVACSLESLVVGEDQILHQVREAQALAERNGLSGRLLGPVFQSAVQLGKQVRSETELCSRPVSVVSVGVAELARRFAGVPVAKPRVALIGAGRMGALAARACDQAGFPVALFVNRSIEAALDLARQHGGEAIGLKELCRGADAVDALISATSAPGFVVRASCLVELARRAPLGRPLVAIDLALPRDLEPVSDPRVEIVDLEALRGVAAQNRGLREAAVAAAEVLVERKLEVFARRHCEQALSAAIAELSAETSEIAERELAQLFTGRLAGLAAEDRRAVERWARAAFGRMSHVPLAAIKRLARDLSTPDACEAEAGE